MAKIFLVISIVVTALTAALGFLTKSKVDSLQTNLKSTQAAKADAEDRVAKKTKELTTAQGELANTKKELETERTTVTTLTADLNTAKAEAAKAKEEVAIRQATVEKLEKEIASRPMTDPNAPKGENPELIRLSEELAKARTEMAEKEKLREAADKRATEAQERLTTAEGVIRRYQEPMRIAGTSGRVMSVNSGWNFVITDLGDQKGATLNAPLVVMRGSQMVGRLRITQVEPNTSVADIVPGSIARGTTVQPGDRVVFAGRTTSPDKPPGGAPAAPTAVPPAGGAPAGTGAGTAAVPPLPGR